MDIPLKKSKTKGEIKDEFSVDEDKLMDICSFTDGEAKAEGAVLRTFSFDDEDNPVEISAISPNPSTAAKINLTPNENSIDAGNKPALNHNKDFVNSNAKEEITDHRALKSNPNGRTPAVDGEAFDMIRSYSLRRSTVRILSKIKAIHSDDNVYLNTIVDEAIRYYYEYLKNNA